MTDAGYMSRALQLARRGLYSTSPNPRVGCVLVNNGTIVGEGWHQKAGEGHAEVNALRAAGDRARGATAYVTLEPCSHFGRTPPCAQGLIDAGITPGSRRHPRPEPAGCWPRLPDVACCRYRRHRSLPGRRSGSH